MYSVRDYAAVGDGHTNDRDAIQRAIDACAEAGGGTVLLPAGDYLSGELWLKSHVLLHLEAGATLRASRNPQDYTVGETGVLRRHGTLLNARHCRHIGVVGQGIVHGNTPEDYGERWGAAEPPNLRTRTLVFSECQHVVLRDVTFLFSDSWTVHLFRCDNVVVDAVTIHNNIFRLNSDGIDPDCCTNVRIANCHIVAGDDCIVLKSTAPYPCENVVITNCTLETTCAALKLGTESQGDFRDVHVSNCTVRNSAVGMGFYMKDGTTMERVTFEGLSIETNDTLTFGDRAMVRGEGGPPVVYPIFMDIERRHADSPVGTIRDVVFRDVQIASSHGSLIQGMPESPIENLVLEGITQRVTRPVDNAGRQKAIGGRRTTSDERDTRYAQQPAYLTIAHARDVTVRGYRLYVPEGVAEEAPRSAVSLHEAQRVMVSDVVRLQGTPSTAALLVTTENVREARVEE